MTSTETVLVTFGVFFIAAMISVSVICATAVGYFVDYLEFRRERRIMNRKNLRQISDERAAVHEDMSDSRRSLNLSESTGWPQTDSGIRRLQKL